MGPEPTSWPFHPGRSTGRHEWTTWGWPARKTANSGWTTCIKASPPQASIISVAGTISNRGRFGLGTGSYRTTFRCSGSLKQLSGSITSTQIRSPTHVYFLYHDSSVLFFHRSLTSFCSRHRNAGITLTWSPVHRDRIQDSTVRYKALAACTLTPRASLNRVQSAAYQKQVTKRQAFTKWAEWHADRRKRYGTDSFAYEYALTNAPSGRNHPLWKAAAERIDGAPSYSHHTTTTALRLALGHAFISDYTRRFRLDIPEEENHCLCGFPDHSFHHLLYDCPRHTQARLTAGGRRQWDDDSPLYYFRESSSSGQLLNFLQISRAAFLPPGGETVPFDQGDRATTPDPTQRSFGCGARVSPPTSTLPVFSTNGHALFSMPLAYDAPSGREPPVYYDCIFTRLSEYPRLPTNTVTGLVQCAVPE